MQRILNEKAMTSIRVKLSTRNLVRERSLPGESMDDIIVRIINENDKRSKEIDYLRKLLENHNIVEPNVISVHSQVRTKDTIGPINSILIVFSYNIPQKGNNDYIIDIMVERVIKDEKTISFDDLNLGVKDRNRIYFQMVERVINEYFDRGFSLQLNRNLMDEEYWKKVWKRVGLSDTSFMNDILGKM